MTSTEDTAKPAKRGSGALTALLGSAFAAAAGGIAYSSLAVPHELPLPNAVSGERREIDGRAGRLSYYVAGAGEPLLLIHSINATASAYEMRPLFEHYKHSRRVYALDLPGFGFAERGDREYTPRLYTDAVLVMVDEVARDSGAQSIDAVALSLSSEFLARAASEQPTRFRNLALISPTAFKSGDRFYQPTGSIRGVPWLAAAFKFPLWKQALFNSLNSRVSQRYYTEKTFGSKQVDEGLLAYQYPATHQPGAAYAPLSFISGMLFSADIDRVYDQLELPVWLAHGVRGDFTDYGGIAKVRNRPNWSIQSFETGALPYYEDLAGFVARLDAFLHR